MTLPRPAGRFSALPAALAAERSTAVAATAAKHAAKLATGEYVLCPACKGATFSFYWLQEFPDDPPIRDFCTHCSGVGVLAMDCRSMHAAGV